MGTPGDNDCSHLGGAGTRGKWREAGTRSTQEKSPEPRAEAEKTLRKRRSESGQLLFVSKPCDPVGAGHWTCGSRTRWWSVYALWWGAWGVPISCLPLATPHSSAHHAMGTSTTCPNIQVCFRW